MASIESDCISIQSINGRTSDVGSSAKNESVKNSNARHSSVEFSKFESIAFQESSGENLMESTKRNLNRSRMTRSNDLQCDAQKKCLGCTII